MGRNPTKDFKGHLQDFLSLLIDRQGHRNVDVSTCGLTGSLLAFDVDSSECGLLGSLEDHAGFACREANSAIILALDQVLSTMVAQELYAIARSSVGIFVFALEGKPFHNGIKADVWLIPMKSW